MNKDRIKRLAHLANMLDEKGFHKMADGIDKMVKGQINEEEAEELKERMKSVSPLDIVRPPKEEMSPFASLANLETVIKILQRALNNLIKVKDAFVTKLDLETIKSFSRQINELIEHIGHVASLALVMEQRTTLPPEKFKKEFED